MNLRRNFCGYPPCKIKVQKKKSHALHCWMNFWDVTVSKHIKSKSTLLLLQNYNDSSQMIPRETFSRSKSMHSLSYIVISSPLCQFLALTLYKRKFFHLPDIPTLLQIKPSTLTPALLNLRLSEPESSRCTCGLHPHLGTVPAALPARPGPRSPLLLASRRRAERAGTRAPGTAHGKHSETTAKIVKVMERKSMKGKVIKMKNNNNNTKENKQQKRK